MPFEHTPGPWTAYGTWVSAGPPGEGPVVADCDWDADAILIAAAPEMLEALEWAEAHDALPFRVQSFLREVIAKAKGNETA